MDARTAYPEDAAFPADSLSGAHAPAGTTAGIRTAETRAAAPPYGAEVPKAAPRAINAAEASDAGRSDSSGTAPFRAEARTEMPAGTLPAPADSLRTDSLHADSLPAFPFPVQSGPADLPGETPAVRWRDTTAAAVFGPASVEAAPRTLPPSGAPSLTDNAVFQSFVLLLAATYATLLYRNIGDIRTLVGHISRDAASRQRLSEDPGSSGFSRFLHIVTAIGMLVLGVFAVKYGDALRPRLLTDTLSHGAVLAMSLLATLACTAIVACQAALVRIAGAVTVSQPFVSQLMLLRRTYFALAVIVTSPALLLFALCPRGTGNVWFSVITIELAMTAFLYLKESLNLFISKKISILHWFLYLCTVEIFPVSLLWLSLVR